MPTAMLGAVVRAVRSSFRKELHLASQSCSSVSHVSCSRYSTESGKGFVQRLADLMNEELKKNKELKDNLQRLKEASDKLEDADALKDIRNRYKIEAETARSTERLWKAYSDLETTVKKVFEDVKKSEYGQRGAQASDSVLRSAQEALNSVDKLASSLGVSSTVKAMGEGLYTLKSEIDAVALARARMYQRPDRLRKRSDRVSNFHTRTVQANDEATGIELHKEAKWYQSWKSFTENNPYVSKMWDWKLRYDESENPILRTTRFFTYKLTSALGSVFAKTELSDVLTEICKIDPNFSKDDFLKECEREIIPNILEAIVRGDLEILKDWCYEAVYKLLEEPIKRAHERGLVFGSKVLDIDNVDLVMGKIMDQGPVLIITFQTQQIEVLFDKAGKVVEGNADTPLRVNHVWVLCRDPEELDPKAAWKLLELHMSGHKQWL